MGLEEAVVNQATVWPESGADRTASSRENPVPSTASFFVQNLQAERAAVRRVRSRVRDGYARV